MTYDELVPGDILMYGEDRPDLPIWLMVNKEGGCASWIDLYSGRLVEDDPLGREAVHADYTVIKREGE